MIYVVKCGRRKPVEYIKGKDADDAKKKSQKGLKPELIRELDESGEYEVFPLTMEYLEKNSPKDFMIEPNSGW